jgi:hypothetical protein
MAHLGMFIELVVQTKDCAIYWSKAWETRCTEYNAAACLPCNWSARNKDVMTIVLSFSFLERAKRTVLHNALSNRSFIRDVQGGSWQRGCFQPTRRTCRAILVTSFWPGNYFHITFIFKWKMENYHNQTEYATHGPQLHRKQCCEKVSISHYGQNWSKKNRK